MYYNQQHHDEDLTGALYIIALLALLIIGGIIAANI